MWYLFLGDQRLGDGLMTDVGIGLRARRTEFPRSSGLQSQYQAIASLTTDSLQKNNNISVVPHRSSACVGSGAVGPAPLAPHEAVLVFFAPHLAHLRSVQGICSVWGDVQRSD